MKISWEIIERFKDNRELIRHFNKHINHIFREANQLADYITNTTIHLTGMQ